MATVGLLVHHTSVEATRLAQEAAAWLHAQGHSVRLPAPDAAIAGLGDAAVGSEQFGRELDLAVSLGGDGTMLRTVELVADAGVPVLGVNLGHLGYLAEVEPESLTSALARVLDGDHDIEERLRLEVQIEQRGERPPTLEEPGALPIGARSALNEAVLGKTPSGQIVRVVVTIDGERFTTYVADAVILATPTGSTAYAWSAGGPIVAPSHRAMLLTPVAPHMLFDRALVLPPTSCVRLEVGEGRPADLSLDGRSLGPLGPGDAVVCTAAERPARLVTFGGRSFLEILKAKFGLAER
jgi:NAD+ kinase